MLSLSILTYDIPKIGFCISSDTLDVKPTLDTYDKYFFVSSLILAISQVYHGEFVYEFYLWSMHDWRQLGRKDQR